MLDVNGLTTDFVTRSASVRAVDDVSFAIAAGETLALVGESGCGKSATALSLMRLIGPPGGAIAGSIRFDGIDVMALDVAGLRRLRGKNVAMIFQDPMTSLNPVLTIGLQLGETLQTHLGLSVRAARRRARELLEMVGIPEAERRLGDYPHQFSGGMRQRVMIAMALSCRPRLILADEITTALDVTIQAQILELLKRLTRELQTAILLITHDLGVVAGMADRVNVMYAGQIVESAATLDLFLNPSMPYTRGLLDSIPRIDSEVRERLVPIRGVPPNLANPPPGCRFEPRCAHRRDICAARMPTLRQRPNTTAPHLTRCWAAQDVAEGGWLIGRDRHTVRETLAIPGDDA
ncbi:MAG: ABC transporter ATP-binding protein [Alphaproteobacteria bacterium]|nr:ABC transporter ATP-binding protein [Alphaproteobacteria bacterium]